MVTLNFEAKGRALTVSGSPKIICDNPIYSASVTFTNPAASGISQAVLYYQRDHDDDPEPDSVTLISGAATLPAFPGAFGVVFWIRIKPTSGDEYDTGRVWVPCIESIKSIKGVDFSQPYDAYNNICQYANMIESGLYTDEEIRAKAEYIQQQAALPRTYPGLAYKRAVSASIRCTYLTGTFKTRAGTTIDLDNNNISERSVGISANALTGEYILPGGVPSSELSATMLCDLPNENLYGSEIDLTFHLRLESGKWFAVPLGVFTVSEVRDDYSSGTAFTAYDDMHKLDNVDIESVNFLDGVAYSPNQIISKICDAADIDYEQNVDFSTDFVNVQEHSYVVVCADAVADVWLEVIENADDIEDVAAALAELGITAVYKGDVTYPSELPSGADFLDAYKVEYGGPVYTVSKIGASVETARDLLMHTVFTICAFAKIDRYRKMQVVPLKKSASAEIFDEYRTSRRSASRLPYRLYELSTTIEYINSDGNPQAKKVAEQTLWSDYDVRAEAQTNSLWTTLKRRRSTNSQYSEIVSKFIQIISKLDPITLHPMQAEVMKNDPTVELFDWMSTDSEGTRTAPVTSNTWHYRGTQTISCGGESAIAGAAKSQAQKRLDGDKIEALDATNNLMREIYGTLMQASYGAMENFTYSNIEHYTYRELGGGTIA